MARDSVKQTFLVAVLLCLVCSLLVSSSAVGLRSLQEDNKRTEKQKNILIAAGLFDPDQHSKGDVEEMFKQVAPIIIDLDTGEEISKEEYANLKDYDQKQASKKPELSQEIEAGKDIAGIKRRERYSYIYIVKEDGKAKKYILPIRGYGLWSILWGFVAVDAQSLKQGPEHLAITGLKYYDQKETPGLGGEVDSDTFLKAWSSGEKQIYDANWNVKIHLTKSQADGAYEVDALSGATITSNGVTNMMQYWFGEEGFRKFLKNRAKQ